MIDDSKYGTFPFKTAYLRFGFLKSLLSPKATLDFEIINYNSVTTRIDLQLSIVIKIEFQYLRMCKYLNEILMSMI